MTQVKVYILKRVRDPIKPQIRWMCRPRAREVIEKYSPEISRASTIEKNFIGKDR
jgi:hypothetical protein